LHWDLQSALTVIQATCSGEEINWQMISSGGLINGISDNYLLLF